MGFRWYLLKRVGWTIVVLWLVLSGSFFLFAYTPDPNVSLVKFSQFDPSEAPNKTVTEQKEAVAAYRDARNYDEPVFERYRRWVVGYATFNWGTSTARIFGPMDRGAAPVTTVVANRGLVTLTYLLPALLVSTVGGIVLGQVAAARRGTMLDVGTQTVAYVGYGVPVFFLALALAGVAAEQFGVVGLTSLDSRYRLYAPRNVDIFLIPFLVMSANLLAVQTRYVRAEALEYLQMDFVKVLRAKGGSEYQVAKHALRNALIPLLSLFFNEVLTVLFVSIYFLEPAIGLPGLGAAAYDAIRNRDIALILGTTMVPVFIGIAGNLLQDIAYTVLDPRISYE